MADPDLKVDGLLCPGHVSAIIGANAYQPLTEQFGLGCAVAGFEPADILAGLLSLIKQINEGTPRVDNCYTRAVTATGNAKAQAMITRRSFPRLTPNGEDWGLSPAAAWPCANPIPDLTGCAASASP